MKDLGEVWAYRAKPNTPETPVHPVEILQQGPPSKAQRLRIRRLDGEYDGMDEWVPALRLVCPWDKVEAFLRDERKTAELMAAVEGYDEVQTEAADFVLETVLGLSADTGVMGYDRRSYGTFMVWDTDKLPHTDLDELLAAPHAFLTSGGGYLGPWTVGVEVARRVCAHDPHAVLAAVIEAEKDSQRTVINSHLEIPRVRSAAAVSMVEAEQRLRKRQPVLDQVRQWCGADRAQEWDRIAALHAEVDRIRRFAERMIDWLEDAGHRSEAATFRRQLLKQQ